MGINSARAFGTDNRGWLADVSQTHAEPQAEPLRFACPLCGKRWRQSRSVIQHLESSYHRSSETKAEKADRMLEAFRATTGGSGA